MLITHYLSLAPFPCSPCSYNLIISISLKYISNLLFWIIIKINEMLLFVVYIFISYRLEIKFFIMMNSFGSWFLIWWHRFGSCFCGCFLLPNLYHPCIWDLGLRVCQTAWPSFLLLWWKEEKTHICQSGWAFLWV